MLSLVANNILLFKFFNVTNCSLLSLPLFFNLLKDGTATKAEGKQFVSLIEVCLPLPSPLFSPSIASCPLVSLRSLHETARSSLHSSFCFYWVLLYLYPHSPLFLFNCCSCEFCHLGMLYIVFDFEPTLGSSIGVTLCAAVLLAARLRIHYC